MTNFKAASLYVVGLSYLSLMKNPAPKLEANYYNIFTMMS